MDNENTESNHDTKKSWINRKLDIIKSELHSEPPKKAVKNLFYLIIGALVMSAGEAFFIIPMNIISGGVSSLAIIFHSIPATSGISIQTYLYIFNWGLFVLGLFTLGLRYSLRTLLFTVAYPLLVQLFTFIIDVTVIDGVRILDVTAINPIMVGESQIDGTSFLALAYLISALIGGTLIGAGIGYTFIGGGSSGGTDVISLLLHKYFHISAGASSFICDFIIIFAGFFANGHNLVASLVGISSAILCGLLIDKVFLGNKQYFVALIVSKKWREINDIIMHDIERGTTLIQAQGGYTRVDTVLLEVCFPRTDYSTIQNLINGVDPNAFVTIIKAQEIVGYGFTRDTPEVNMKDLALPPDEAQRILLKSLKRSKKRNALPSDKVYEGKEK
ncbi:MAG: YitT family protein [Bacilli bacterium]|jgi:uncharacterized membrane-anchored protein YitT (DUF2179 family)